MNVRVFSGCAALLFTTTAQGQACLGLASLETRPMNVSVSARFADGVTGGGARFGFGTARAFGGVSGAMVKADGVSGTTKGASVDGGLSFNMGEKKQAMLCPVASVEYLKAPDFDDGEGGTITSSATGASAGLAGGGLFNTSSSVSFIPSAAVSAAYQRVSVSDGQNSATDSETYGILSGGLSFVFSPSLLVRPFISVPFGLDGSNDPLYGVGVSFAFGKR